MVFMFYSMSVFAESQSIDSLKKLIPNKNNVEKLNIYKDLSQIYLTDNLDSAAKYIDFAIEIVKAENNIEYLKCRLAKAEIEFYKGNYPEALNINIEALKTAESLKDKKLMSKCMIQISLSYQYQGPENFQKALEYAKMALTNIENEEKSEITINALFQIGRIYSDPICEAVFNIDSGQYYYSKCLVSALNFSSNSIIAEIYGSLGFLYIYKNDFDNALNIIKKALDIYVSENNETGKMLTYYRLAELYKNKNEYNLAEEYYFKSIELAVKTDFIDLTNNIYEGISGLYTQKGDFESALLYFKKSVDLKFKLYSEERVRAFADLEKKYESEKKEKEIAILNKDKLLNQKEIDKQKLVRNYLLILVGLILIVIIIGIYAYINKIKINKLLVFQKKQIEDKNFELNQQNEEICAQRDEIEAQRNEISKHRDLVVLQKEEIESSINYALRIQNAVLPSIEHLSMFLGDYFILFKPKDVVSGDFYWATIIKNWQIITVADCTGHGVPGAFMSMLGVSFLNEIVRKQEITKASDVLNHLRKSVVESLQQTGESGTQKDGMDMSIAVINIETNHLQWAGANNPLWIVSGLTFDVSGSTENEQTASANNELQTTNNELFELKPDKMPIAIYERMDDFTNHELQLNSGDIIYLLSDGYQDQFGGPNGKKFHSKNLKQLLIANCQLSMPEQKQILEKTLVDWIGDGEQIDDISILGIKI